MRKQRDLVEIFGYAPEDITKNARALWNVGACPFINKQCIKINHDQTITYGTCSVTSPYGDIIICPNRLYANEYYTISNIGEDAFPDAPFFLFSDYIRNRSHLGKCVVALGKNSGREVQVGKSLSMDWVLALVDNGRLAEYAGIEVQSIDITGNYRDAWHGYKNLEIQGASDCILASSCHGLNWANVHKRLIPQLIRKGVVYSRSKLVRKGLYFVLPEIVYRKFEDIIGADIELVTTATEGTLTVHTYELGPVVPHGEQRSLVQVRRLRFSLDDFANRFISGPNLPSGEELDAAIVKMLGLA